MLIKERLELGTKENQQTPEILIGVLQCGILRYFNAKVLLRRAGGKWDIFLRWVLIGPTGIVEMIPALSKGLFWFLLPFRGPYTLTMAST